jgi:RNA polymerase sigma-70 factor (ECF subfamily)
VAEDLATTTDLELARESRAGSLSAFEELVSRYERRVYGFVRNFCRDDHGAREVTQDTFVRAYQCIHQYSGEHPFSSWLLAIARRKCIDRFRAARPFANEPLPQEVEWNDPSEMLARREDQAALWRLARTTLSADQFQALWLRYIEDLPVAEIACVLRKTKTHVKVLLFRARRALLSELERTPAYLERNRRRVEARTLEVSGSRKASARSLLTPAATLENT